MDVSKFLSKVIGLYEIIISAALLVHMQRLTGIFQSMISNEPLMLYIGCITVIMGILMIISHNIWEWRWRVLVTMVAWIVFIEGAALLLLPHSLDSLTRYFTSNLTVAYAIAVVDLLLGILFCYFGFRQKA